MYFGVYDSSRMTVWALYVLMFPSCCGILSLISLHLQNNSIEHCANYAFGLNSKMALHFKGILWHFEKQASLLHCQESDQN